MTTKTKYWYVCTIYSCPVCFREVDVKHRVYKKPRSYYRWENEYDSCIEMGGLYL